MNIEISKKFAGIKPSAVREILKTTNDPEMIAFAGGSPATEAFPCDAVRKISNEILTENAQSALVYGVSEGYEPLRRNVAEWLLKYEGINSENDSIIITSGGTQVMDLAARVLLSEGDAVICEDPSFVGSLNCFRSHGCGVVGVPIDSDGMNINSLEQAVKSNKNAKVIYTIPNFQNPGGTTLSLEKRKQMYRIAKENHLVIIEDNPYGSLRVSGKNVSAIKSFDSESLVVYAGSFSKVLAPGIRVAYAAVPKQIAGAFTIAKQVSDVHTGVLNQMIVSRWLSEYDIDSHLESIRRIYRKKLDLMCSCLDEYCADFISYVRPEGGLFIWAKLDDGIDMLQYVKKLIDKKVAVVPGSAFMCNDAAKCNHIRLNFSTPSEADIIKGVKIMADTAKQ